MANRTPFRIDLEQTQGIVLGSLREFQQSVQAFPGITENDSTKKAILILQKYITSIKNFNNLCDARQEFFRSKQFVNTFTEQLVNLVSVEAPSTYIQFKQELNDESKSSTTQFLDTIFLKSYGPKGAGSWRKGYEKILYSKGTLCNNVQPINEVPVVNADRPSDIELQNYAQGLDPSIKAVARQNATPSQLINYSFSGGAGFTLQGVCYLCGLPIQRVTPNSIGNTNCEHIMPILSALQSWDFIFRYEVIEPITQIKRQLSTNQVFNQLTPNQQRHIKRLFEISDEFAWAHWCCNMLKLDLDFLHLNNNGKYVPHYYNIKIFLGWLVNNGGMYDCVAVLQGLNINTAKASLMIRIKRLCKVLNERNEGVNPNSGLNLIKVYGIFLLLQYVTVTSFSKIISLQGQTGLGITTATGGNPFGIAKNPTEPVTPPTRRKLPTNRTQANEPVTPTTPVSSVNKSRFPRFPLRIQPTELQQEKKRHQTKVAQAMKEAVNRNREAVSYQNTIQILKTHFYEAIPRIPNIEDIKRVLSQQAGNIDASTTLLNSEDDRFNTMVSTLVTQDIWTGMINLITTQSSGQGLDVSAIIGPANIESICLGWFRDMVYDYLNIKLMITIRTAEYTELQTRAGTGDANAAAAANILENDIRCLQAMSVDITTLQGMITQAHSQIYLPLVQGLTTRMGTWSPIVDHIDNVDNIIFSLEQLMEIGAGFVTEDDVVGQTPSQPPIQELIQELIGQIQAQAPLILPQFESYIQYINQQILQIPYIQAAVTANLEGASLEGASLDVIAANIPALSDKITELQARYNTLVSANIQHASTIPPPNQDQIQQVALSGVALVKLKELLLSRNLQHLPQQLTLLLGNIAELQQNVELIKSTLIEPLVAFQTYMTSGFTNIVLSQVPDIVAVQGAAAAEGGGKLIRKRKTTRRNVVIKRKKQHKSRKNKTRKNKTHKNKTHKIKTRKYKTRRHKRL